VLPLSLELFVPLFTSSFLSLFFYLPFVSLFLFVILIFMVGEPDTLIRISPFEFFFSLLCGLLKSS
jgi:hypothetical protein